MNHLINFLWGEYNCFDLNRQNLTLLKRGRYANANIYQFEVDEKLLVVKEFYSQIWFIRVTIGRLLVFRELKMLRSLAGIPGVPGEVRRIGPYALAMTHVGNEALKRCHHSGRKLPKAFFLELERLVDSIHRAGYVHLDLRNMGNIICDNAGKPRIIDFQTCLKTTNLPRKVRRFMEDIDRSGIYKNWSRVCEDQLDPERKVFQENFDNVRKFWFFKGYWLRRRWSRLSSRIKNSFG